jgi:hypothetical protein
MAAGTHRRRRVREVQAPHPQRRGGADVHQRDRDVDGRVGRVTDEQFDDRTGERDDEHGADEVGPDRDADDLVTVAFGGVPVVLAEAVSELLAKTLSLGVGQEELGGLVDALVSVFALDGLVYASESTVEGLLLVFFVAVRTFLWGYTYHRKRHG